MYRCRELCIFLVYVCNMLNADVQRVEYIL
jgi:hypothetical protein